MNDFQKLLSIIENKVDYSTICSKCINPTYPNVVYTIIVKNSKIPEQRDYGTSDCESSWLFDKDYNFIAVGHWI